MIASLPMYWRPENAALWRAFWAEVQAAAPLDLPDLTPPDDIPAPWTDHWLRPDLALSMTCGLPFRTVLKAKVTYVGTLDFGLNTAPGHYVSQIIRRHGPDDPDRPALNDAILAYNSADSQSGWAVTQQATPYMRKPTFTKLVETGSHAGSLAAVAEGRADVAFLDAVTWRILQRFDPNAGRVFEAGRSVATPGLPFITALGTDPAPLRAALLAATRRFEPEDAEAMGGPMRFVVLDPDRYFTVPIPTPP